MVVLVVHCLRDTDRGLGTVAFLVVAADDKGVGKDVAAEAPVVHAGAAAVGDNGKTASHGLVEHHDHGEVARPLEVDNTTMTVVDTAGIRDVCFCLREGDVFEAYSECVSTCVLVEWVDSMEDGCPRVDASRRTVVRICGPRVADDEGACNERPEDDRRDATVRVEPASLDARHPCMHCKCHCLSFHRFGAS